MKRKGGNPSYKYIYAIYIHQTILVDTLMNLMKYFPCLYFSLQCLLIC